MKVICFECNKLIGEKTPFSDGGVTHTICEPCLKKTLDRLRDERRHKKGGHHPVTSTS